MKQFWLLLAMLALALSTATAADMYSWTDAQGVKHFSDSPPPNSVKAQKIRVKGGVTSSAAAETPEPTTAAGPAMAAAAGYSPDDIVRNCEVARTNLGTLEAQQPTLDEDGNPVDAAAEQAQQSRLDKAKQQIALFCKK